MRWRAQRVTVVRGRADARWWWVAHPFVRSRQRGRFPRWKRWWYTAKTPRRIL